MGGASHSTLKYQKKNLHSTSKGRQSWLQKETKNKNDWLSKEGGALHHNGCNVSVGQKKKKIGPSGQRSIPADSVTFGVKNGLKVVGVAKVY